MPNQAIRPETVCGWLVMLRGTAMGQDFRIVNGTFRIGSEPGLEASIPAANLTTHALTLSVTTKECKVSWIADGHKLFINGVHSAVDAILKESDTILIDHVEGYIKWYRS